ncbi:hypothetical protein QQ045_005729 [Rhodiola kirilowii]
MKMHVAMKYFETTTDGVSRGWRKAFEDDAVHPTAGADDKAIVKISDHFLLDLNATPAGDDLIVEEDNDDAQSSCNGFSDWVSDPVHETELSCDEYAFQDCCSVERPWEEEADEEDGEVNMSAKRRHINSKNCIDSSGANEVERNKIFWETCLASGF